MLNTRVFVDTNIIIEATRINCWSGLSQRHSIETVEKCVEEAFTGQNPVPKEFLKGIATCHNPSQLDIANLIISYPEFRGLDDGELHLLAFLHAEKIVANNIVLIATADRAALRAACILQWSDSLVSLEKILIDSGVSNTQINQLKQHYRTKWLTDIRTDFILEQF